MRASDREARLAGRSNSAKMSPDGLLVLPRSRINRGELTFLAGVSSNMQTHTGPSRDRRGSPYTVYYTI